MSLQLSGLASGFDWKSLVSQLMQAERIPLQRIYSQQSTLTKEKTAWGDLSTKLDNLKDIVRDLNSSEVFTGRKATSSVTEEPALTAYADSGTLTGEYKFEVVSMATATKLAGSSDVGSSIAASSDVSGTTLSTLNLSTKISEGTFTVNGEQVTIATSDSLQDVFDKISTATGGAVTGSYDSGTDQVTLSGASVVLGSASDTSNFLQAMKLYSNEAGNAVSSSALGAVNLSAGLDSGYTGLGTPPTVASSFTINGEEIAYDPASDTLREVMQRINSSEAGVRITYDSTADKFQMESTRTGSLDISMTDSAEGFLAQLGLTSGTTKTLGSNATFRVNDGSLLTSNSNEFTEDVHGITGLSVTASEIGTETITVAPDNKDAKDKIKEFITAYNSVQSFIADKTKTTVDDDKVKTNIFSGDREVSAIQSELRKLAFDSVDGLNSTVKRLADIGIDFKTGTSELEIEDEEKLDEMLATESDDVTSLFIDTNDGMANKLIDYIERLTNSGGTIDLMEDSIDSKSDTLDDQIDRQERYLANYEENLTKQFLRMEEAQSQMQQQLQGLLNSL